MVSVSPSDGVCRDCGGTLSVVDGDDCSMFVECSDCGDRYCVETDAFGDGGVEYWPQIMAELEGGA